MFMINCSQIMRYLPPGDNEGYVVFAVISMNNSRTVSVTYAYV